MTVLGIGTIVDVGDVPTPIAGRISAIFIRGDSTVTYEVAWLNGRTLCRETMSRDEFEVRSDTKWLKIGFANGAPAIS